MEVADNTAHENKSSEMTRFVLGNLVVSRRHEDDIETQESLILPQTKFHFIDQAV